MNNITNYKLGKEMIAMDKKMLIAYYSLSSANTKKIAEMLQKSTNADIVRIETVEPYNGSYETIVNQGQNEVNRGYKPDIKPLQVKMSEYDVIAVGTPTWWYTMAPAVHTFLDWNDWKGKTAIPFMTNGGWPGHVIEDMKVCCKGAKFVCEKEIQFDSTGGSNLETPLQEIEQWIEEIKSL